MLCKEKVGMVRLGGSEVVNVVEFWPAPFRKGGLFPLRRRVCYFY